MWNKIKAIFSGAQSASDTSSAPVCEKCGMESGEGHSHEEIPMETPATSKCETCGVDTSDRHSHDESSDEEKKAM